MGRATKPASRVSGKKRTDTIYRLKITLQDITPPIWRRVETRDCSLEELHEIIQVAMGWEFSHCWAFEIGGEQYSHNPYGPMDDMLDATATMLGDVVGGAGSKKFGYVYDFGDNWQHTVLVEKVLDAEPKVSYPRCVTGKQACPPEDCGGSWGYADFLEAIKDPDHPEHEEMLEWVGGEFDPEAFNLAKTNRSLSGSGK